MGNFDHRQYRGFEIANLGRVIQVEENKQWRVPSSHQNGRRDRYYTVQNDSGYFSCQCPDFHERRRWCKHIWAVKYSDVREAYHRNQRSELAVEAAVRQRPQKGENSHRDWTLYREGRQKHKPLFLKLLSALAQQVTNTGDRTRGRQVDWRGAVIASALKVYSGASSDMFMADYREALDKGYATIDCHPNTILNFFNHEGLEEHLKRLIQISCLPLVQLEDVVAIDSTGFSEDVYMSFYDYKHGNGRERYRGRREKKFTMAHMAVGIRTKIVAAVEIAPDSDPIVFPMLLDQSMDALDVKEILADKAYSTDDVLGVVAAHGVTPYIDFKTNASAKRTGEAFRRALIHYQMDQPKFYDQYYRRNNAETAFSMIKKHFRPHLFFKKDQAKRNEILCKVLCHNIFCLIQSFYTLNVDLKALGISAN